MSDLDIQLQEQLESMTQYEMARMWRFHKGPHPYFDNTNPLSQRFTERFKELGGFTPEISKSLGWEN
jgi:hypothetical protein